MDPAMSREHPKNNRLIGTITLPKNHLMHIDLRPYFLPEKGNLTFSLLPKPSLLPDWVTLDGHFLVGTTPHSTAEITFAFTIQASNEIGICEQIIKLNITPAFNLGEIHRFQYHKPVRLIKRIKPFFIPHKRRFAYYFKPHFLPHKGASYHLLGDQLPDWLHISPMGRLFANVPEFGKDQIIRFAVQAKNEHGSATQECLLVISTTNPFDLEQAMRIHKKAVTALSGTLTESHDLLEYLYHYLVSFDRAQLQALLEMRAQHLAVETKRNRNYQDFRDVMLAINPDIDQHLHDALNDRSKNLLEPISQADFRNMVRQGSQPAGSLAIAVWNYLGAPDPVNISDIFSSVLEESGDRLISMKRENRHHRQEVRDEQRNERLKHLFNPSPKKPGIH
jgi:hypothetical protein